MLIDDIASIENLSDAFCQCLKGKRKAVGANKVFLDWDLRLLELQRNLRKGENFPWGNYREFYVTDPKRRKIAAASFFDRVAHRAIHNILSPILDSLLLPNIFACRIGKGNGRAVVFLRQLMVEHPDCRVVKMDVRKYFASINQYTLRKKLDRVLPDESCRSLIVGLLRSWSSRKGRGLPLGNLTSQLFANFYLNDLDKEMNRLVQGKYLRYMDDLVFLVREKKDISSIVRVAVRMGKRDNLDFPIGKRPVFDPRVGVPFLGFLVKKESVVPFNRNRRRFEKRMAAQIATNVPLYEIYQGIISNQAWRNFPVGASRLRG